MTKKQPFLIASTFLFLVLLLFIFFNMPNDVQTPPNTFNGLPENLRDNDIIEITIDEEINQSDVEPLLQETIVASFSFEDYSQTLTLYSDMFFKQKIATDFTCKEGLPNFYIDSFNYPHRYSIKLINMSEELLFEKNNILPIQGKLVFNVPVDLPCANFGQQYSLIISSNGENESFNFRI